MTHKEELLEDLSDAINEFNNAHPDDAADFITVADLRSGDYAPDLYTEDVVRDLTKDYSDSDRLLISFDGDFTVYDEKTIWRYFVGASKGTPTMRETTNRVYDLLEDLSGEGWGRRPERH